MMITMFFFHIEIDVNDLIEHRSMEISLNCCLRDEIIILMVSVVYGTKRTCVLLDFTWLQILPVAEHSFTMYDGVCQLSLMKIGTVGAIRNSKLSGFCIKLFKKHFIRFFSESTAKKWKKTRGYREKSSGRRTKQENDHVKGW